MKNRLLESISRNMKTDIPVRRYSLAEMISESYKVVFDCKDGSNLKKLAESHLQDVRNNPGDIESLSENLSIIKELVKLEESGQIQDKDLVEKKRPKRVSESRKVRGRRIKESVGYEIWFDGSCVHEEDGFDSEEEANEEAQAYIEGLLEDEGWEDATEDDFDVRFSGDYEESCNTRESNHEDLDEDEDVELTDEEVDELEKHLAEIRKQKKSGNTNSKPQKEEMTETRDYDEEDPGDQTLWDAISTILGDCGLFSESDDGYTPNEEEAIEKLISLVKSGGIKRVGESVEDFDTNKGNSKLVDEECRDTVENKEERVIVKPEYCNESLKDFAQRSRGKAFMKTFKKLDAKLHEGTALTRQESIGLYKAANSAMTHLSVELEHNPEFLKTFKESVAILSKDVNRVMESISRGKAPSKKTMKSLAKFSEAMLCESSYVKEWGSKMLRDYGEVVLAHYDYEKPSDILDFVDQIMDKAINNSEYRDFPGFDDEMIVEFESLVQDYLDNFDYTAVDESKMVNESKDADIKMNSKVEILRGSEKGKTGKVTDIQSNDDEDISELGEYTYEVTTSDGKKQYLSASDLKSQINEADEEDEDLDDIEAEDEDFVGDDEGDIESEEADEFDQEYADARVELHKELVANHAEDEDPEIQEKIAQDAEEVVNLPGTTEEQAAEILGTEEVEDTEEEPEEEMPVEDEVEEEPVEDDSEITDDELAELKSHLKEMRRARKLKESESTEKRYKFVIKTVKGDDIIWSNGATGYKEDQVPEIEEKLTKDKRVESFEKVDM